MNAEELFLTVDEVAEYLRVSRATVWRWCHQGRLRAFKIGREWRVPARDLAPEVLAGRAVPPAPACAVPADFTEVLGHEVAAACQTGSSLALILLHVQDLDALAQRHGPELRDEMLAEVGRVLRRSTRRADIVARLSADTFALLAPGISAAQARQVAVRLCGEIARLGEIGGVPGPALGMRLCAGMAMCPAEARTAGELLRRAQAGMEAA